MSCELKILAAAAMAALAAGGAALAQDDFGAAAPSEGVAETGTAPESMESTATEPDSPDTDAASAGGSGQIRDPLEGLNRVLYSVNNVIDDGLLVPAAKGYRAVTTDGMRKSLRNFLDNAESPGVFLNDILQGKPGRAAETLARFIANSTIGVGGLIDVAAKWGTPPHSEDFGQTLAVWGIGSGPYLYMPLFGPSSARDGVGRILDIAADPLFWVKTNPAELARYSRFGATALASREPFIEPVADIKEKSLDPYASFRSFYVQSREREIRDGVENYDELPDIGAFEELDEIE
ncbi:MAG: VacJ family lipoprotein [Parvularculaceae bacterium]